MRARKRHSMLAILLILGIGIPGSIGIFVVQAKAIASQSEYMAALQVGNTATPTPTLTGTVAPPSPTLTSLPINSLATPFGAPVSTLYAYIQAPNGPVSKPYVVLRAFSTAPRSDQVSISGFVDSRQFVCGNSACVIYLDGNARLVFRAYTAQGVVSEDVIASVRVDQGVDGYIVSIETVSQFTTFTNACSKTWGVFDEGDVTWDDFVQAPYELNTNKTLHVLATELLFNGIVQASDCPAGGLSLGLDWPTACGLERATPKMIEWQNQYDDYIWLASKNQGIPPKIIKTLIEVESQFWPGNQRFYVDEFGLAQMNQLGVDVLLRRDGTLYEQVCPSVLSDCTRPYISLEPAQQAMIRGAVVSLADATCATCEYGLDLNKAKESVSLIAMLLKANCQQVDTILSAAVPLDPDADAATATAAVATIQAGGESTNTTYEDLWRFTFTSYHSGSSCLQEAVIKTKKDRLPITWEHVGKRLKCKGGKTYVDGMMDTLSVFDRYLYQAVDLDVVIPAPTIIPTRTPIPTPTVYISSAKVRVQVFMDRNGNKLADSGEWIDAMTVLLTTSTNQQIEQRTQNGIAVFDMSGYTPGIGINVSLPGLYRSENIILPEQGEVTVTFMFEQPALPTSLP